MKKTLNHLLHQTLKELQGTPVPLPVLSNLQFEVAALKCQRSWELVLYYPYKLQIDLLLLVFVSRRKLNLIITEYTTIEIQSEYITKID